MTDHTTAVQAAPQQTVLTWEQIGELYEDWFCIFGVNTGSAELCIREIEAAVLSKLRAPVADERDRNATVRQVVGMCKGVPPTYAWTAATYMDDEMQRRAALASAPVAGEAQTYLPSRIAVREACDLLDKIKKSHGHWGGWSSIPSVCDEAIGLLRCSGTNAAPQASEAQCSCPSGDGPLRWPCDVHAAPPECGRLKQLAAALGNRDWKWWDSCSFRRLTFEDGPDRRDGSALHATVQASDGHPDVNMAPGVREFIEAASPQAVGHSPTKPPGSPPSSASAPKPSGPTRSTSSAPCGPMPIR